jgi:pyruvate/2-oxoglutarate dehydrogenase complex dihydrolipoamide dehydrogenase (E3) component
MAFDYDIIAIGGGAAGLVTAAGAAGLGARAALIEKQRMGGECLWTGCVPSKALLACARAAADARAAGRYGIHTGDVSVDFRRVIAHVHQARLAIAPNDSPERFTSLGVEVIAGEARFVSERTVRIGTRTISGRHLVIATGSRPIVPPIPGLKDIAYHTNETIFEITEQPQSLIVLGGGAIGVEMAQAFALLGTRVTLIEAAPRILATEDAELTNIVEQELISAGVSLHPGTKLTGVAKHENGIRAQTGSTTFEADMLLVATGRASVLDTIDVAAGGVSTNKGELVLDRKLQTTASNVWAAGDVTGGPRFTHVADYQARTVLRNALFPLSASVDYDVVPRVTYCIPELARVGLTHDEAVQRHGDKVRAFTRSFRELDRAIADGHTTGMLKIVADAKGRILGGHVLGHHASSIIAEIALAMKEGIPLGRLASLMHAYPTYAEAVKQSADGYVRSRFTGISRSVANWIVRKD